MNDDDKYGKYEDDPKAWLEKINQAHWEQTQAQAKLPKKTVWALVSIEVEIEPEDDEEYSDEALMDTIAEELAEYGYTIDEMGMMNPTDLDKFYPETEECK
jgi:hypothetical protein